MNILKNLVLLKYPDAAPIQCVGNSICIFSKEVNRRLSGYFFNEDQAWESAAQFNSYERKRYDKNKKALHP